MGKVKKTYILNMTFKYELLNHTFKTTKINKFTCEHFVFLCADEVLVVNYQASQIGQRAILGNSIDKFFPSVFMLYKSKIII